ncbi:MAG: DUF6569 family protein [Myxococcota bacterium]|nr:DUF6569 family protein [Myxococcota bacterium]
MAFGLLKKPKRFPKIFRFGEPLKTYGYTIFPIFSLGVQSSFLTTPEAMRMGLLEISEKHDTPGPWFRNLLVRNKGEQPVLMREADILIGGKQDRVVDRVSIIQPGSSVVIPVSCVEQNRSHYRENMAFSCSQTSLIHDLRSDRTARIQTGREVQSQTWNMVSHERRNRGEDDVTGSIVEHRTDTQVEWILDGLNYPENATGIAIVENRGEKLHLLLEWFGNAQACKELWKSILRSCVRSPSVLSCPAVDIQQMTQIIQQVQNQSLKRESNHPELGEMWHINDPDYIGTATKHDGKWVHLSLMSRLPEPEYL